MRRRRRRGSGGHWAAVAAAVTVAAVLPFVGAWAAADPEPPERPVAAPPSAPVPELRPEPKPVARKPAARRAARRPKDAVALGAYIPGATDRPALVDRFERKTGRRPAILMYFRRFREARAFDLRTLRRVHGEGAAPMVTWEPWDQSLSDIASGRYDAYLRSEARAARRWGRVILVRFAHEMNGYWYPWGEPASTEATYVRAWRRVVRTFRREKARNVRFIWAPNADTGGERMIRRLYPGDRWVDWVGMSGFGWGGRWDWRQPGDVWGWTYRLLVRLSDKPVMIAETGAGEVGGDKASWIRRAFGRDLPRMRRVRAIVWFDERDQYADFRVDSTRTALRAFRAAVTAPRYAATAADVKRGGQNR